MPRSKSEVPCIIATMSPDAACCAAAILLKYDESYIELSSQNRIQSTLQDQLERDPLPAQVHICGLGISRDVSEVVERLLALRRAGVKVIWYCGRGYLDEYRGELEKACQVVFERAESNTDVVLKYLKLPGDGCTNRLREIAREYVEVDSGARKQPSSKISLHYFLVKRACYRYQLTWEADYLRNAIQQLAEMQPISEMEEEQVRRYQSQRERQPPLGTSEAMKKVRKKVERLARLEEPVLILGESGVGKELVAQALHNLSARNHKEFLSINCAVVSGSPQLAADRLFGHKKGSFTDAHEAADGAFVGAHLGTLFLDELAELSLDVQTQLLRVLEEKTITPLGTNKSIPVDVRIIAATNRELTNMVAQGRFREDLYYRLAVLTIEVPPLRERMEDARSIASMVQGDLRKRAKDPGMEKLRRFKVGPEDWKVINGYGWPGNVRQFITVLKRAALTDIPIAESIAEETPIGKSTSNGTATSRTEPFLPLPRSPGEVQPIEQIDILYMTHVLSLCNSYKQASEAMGISENTLRKYVPKPERTRDR